MEYDSEFMNEFEVKSSVFGDVTPCSALKVTDVSEQCVTSIFRAEE
jgi:hypothetical protein